ncbi:MAG TPA: phospholipase D family protein [Dyella sp.]|uniref:phospholipase D-like domain-containing protein n=1 Tax=Dyella sp. TaxID=1869338 RepID=UPI002F91CC96
MRQRLGLLFLTVAFVSLLSGCSLSHTRIAKASEVVASDADTTVTCDRPDRCASPSALLDAGHEALAESTDTQPMNVVALLSDSEPAMVARLNLIHGAQRSIDIQTYIWDQDDVGLLVLNELIAAARRGVKVRILADQLSSFSDADLLSKLARVHSNLEIRLYNPTFHKAQTPPWEFAASLACCFLKFNQRMHNKLILVDNTVGITGGRNYQDRYFNWDNDFDYLDRDVLVGGAAAKAMAQSFDLFWNHKRSKPLVQLRDVNSRILANPGPVTWSTPHYEHPIRVARALEEADDAAWIEDNILDDSMRTGQVEYFSDLPAKTEKPQQRDAREFTARVMRLVGGAKREVILQTPYLVMSKRAQNIFLRLRESQNPPRIVVSTNSLASTDAFAVYALSYKHRKRYLKNYGFEIYEMKPHAQLAVEANTEAASDDGQPISTPATGKAGKNGKAVRRRSLIRNTESRALLGSSSSNRPAPISSEGRRFGLHAKSIVVDDNFAMVGSHNFDPRSDHYNTEAGVIVYDRRFAEELRGDILADTQPENAWVIAPRKPTIPVLGEISGTLSDISESLPLFDLWPYRYATSYDLKAGCTPMRPTDPGFFACYEPVGDFPDVALSGKLIYTRLITAFGAGVQGVL